VLKIFDITLAAIAALINAGRAIIKLIGYLQKLEPKTEKIA